MKKVDARQYSLFGDDDFEVPVFVSEKKALAEEIKEILSPPASVAVERNLFVLNDAHLEHLGSERSKLDANLKALRTLDALKAQGAAKPTEEQKEAMVAFSGWGGLSGVFAKNTSYPNEQAELQNLLGPVGYQSAMDSVLNAYYTEPFVIRAIWSLLMNMGFEGGRVLEPSCGVGHFIGAMPVDMRKKSKVVMTDIDATSARLAKAVYGDEQTVVHPIGLEQLSNPPGSFDLVVGNVPFGNYRVSDRRLDHLKLNIHDYFFAKALDLVRTGGLVCFITSTGTMDKTSLTFRTYLEHRADLVTAVRLPAGAFKRLGGTDVVSDIVVLRKRAQQMDEAPAKSFAQIDEVPIFLMERPTSAKHFCNSWFLKNPTALLGGKFVATSGRFGERLAVAPANDWVDRLQAVCASPELKGQFDPSGNVPLDARKASLKGDVSGLKSGLSFGYFFSEEGQLMRLSESGVVEDLSVLPTTTLARLEGMTRIRNAVLEVLEADSRESAAAAEKRLVLNALYDSFVKRFGFLMTPHNRRIFSGDSHAPLLWSLEFYDDEHETARKADVFTKSTVSKAALLSKAESIEDAIVISYNKTGKMRIDVMAKALGQTEEQVIQALVTAGRVFLDPATCGWVDSEEYLSGEVLAKLDVALTAAAADPAYQRNVDALKPIIPSPVPLKDVAMRLGAPWLYSELIESFYKEEIKPDAYSSIKVTHMPKTASWSVDGYKGCAEYSTTWGTSRKGFIELLSNLLNQKETEVFDKVELDGKTKLVINPDETLAAQEKAQKIQAAFEAWVFKSEERVAKLEGIYNRFYNGSVNRKYDGSHLVIPDLSAAIKLRPAQLDSVWRGIVSGNTLYALAVGGGKTLIQIVLANESKRLGIASKPMLVVPNHMLEAFAGEYLRAFPKAKVLAMSKDDMDGDRRKTMLMRVAMCDWDCIIVTHSSFGSLGVSKGELERFAFDMSMKAQEAEFGVTDNNAVRDAVRQRKMVEAKIKSLMERSRNDGLLSFDQLGVDMVCVDEADLFKNLWFHTKKKRIPGLSSVCSARALDLFVKTRLIFDKRGNDGYGLHFSTATPIANTIAELFIMQTYLHPWRLQEKNLDNFDAWAANFAREVTAIEVKPEGSGYRLHTRFAKFVNVPELMLLFGEVAEIRTKKMLNLPEPKLTGGKHTVVSVPPSQAQKAYVQSLVERADAIRRGLVKPDEDNMLWVTSDGRKAALDMRIVNFNALNHEGGKVNECIRRVFGIWEETRHKRSTQLVFSDLSVPSNAGFSVYRYIKDTLVEMGVPSAEIAFAQDYSTDKKKADLHRMVRVGKIRILIGSTELMGFGTNVQDKLIAQHQLDAPWRPRDVEQRDGRIIRQGNENEEVSIFRYVTEGTFDAYSWQTLERKAGFIGQIMEFNGQARSVEDVDSQALSFAEVKALASGNPMVIEKAGVDATVARLSALKAVFMSQHRTQQSHYMYLEMGLSGKQNYINNLKATLSQDRDWKMVVVQGSSLAAGAAAGKAIMQRMSAIRAEREAGAPIGMNYQVMTVGGLDVFFNPRAQRLEVGFMGNTMEISLPYGAESIGSALNDRLIEAQMQKSLQQEEAQLQRMRGDMAHLQTLNDVTFEHEEALQAALARQAEIDEALEIDVEDKSLVALAD